MSAIVKFIPRKFVSRCVGFLFNLRGPWAGFIKKKFIAAFQIRVQDAELPLEAYPTLGDFFIRKLKPGLRPLGTSFALVPADSVLTQVEKVQNETLIQAKNQLYSLPHFLSDPEAFKKYKDGYYMTFYLSPSDYHRVHSPVDGFIKQLHYVPGDLWPVNAWSTENISEVFNKNERVVLEIDTTLGPVAVVFVGATNVGSILVNCFPGLQTNAGRAGFQHRFKESVPVKKGDELGMFKLGSTVVVLFNSNITRKYRSLIQPNSKVYVNSDLVTENNH